MLARLPLLSALCGALFSLTSKCCNRCFETLVSVDTCDRLNVATWTSKLASLQCPRALQFMQF